MEFDAGAKDDPDAVVEDHAQTSAHLLIEEYEEWRMRRQERHKHKHSVAGKSVEYSRGQADVMPQPKKVDGTCFRCQAQGHVAAQCPNKGQENATSNTHPANRAEPTEHGPPSERTRSPGRSDERV